MKAKFSLRMLSAALCYILIAAVFFCLLFWPEGNTEEDTQKRVLTIWNVDTFEGGKGSRTAFLRKIARKAEKKRDGVYFLVTSYTPEGAEAALLSGNVPDLLSFGLGLSSFAEKSFPLPYDFAGGKVGSECLAVPWCMGGYYLFSLSDEFEEAGSAAISAGGANLGVLSAACEGLHGEEVDSQAAYVGFLSGKYRYLLGTQRDICRFLSRGATVYSRPLLRYNDLFQYISITKSDHMEDALAFLTELLSEETKSSLSEIGMSPAEAGGETKTPCVFTDKEALSRLHAMCAEGDLKNLDKFLKTI